MKVLIVEDDPNVREELKRLLQVSQYEAIVIEDFENVAAQIIRICPDLVLLDIHLPNQDGHSICREIRCESEVPVIFLTSDDGVMTELDSMLLGADDFVSKPYHPSVLLARMAAVLKRSKKAEPVDESILVYKDVSLNIRTYKIEYQGASAELSKNEFKLLHYLFQRRGEVVPRLDIIEYLWDNEVFIDDNALSVNVTRLRSKMEALGIASFIQTKRGVGYQI